jgi:DNA invertase Pin-like site-specific DNA recombinase
VLAQVCEDRSMSGASRFRPGYQQMVADLASLSEVIVVEALDRLGRKLADVAELHDRLVFASIKLYAVSTGEITAMHIGMLGTMAQLFLADLREDLAGSWGRRCKASSGVGLRLRRDRAHKDGSSGERRVNEAEAAAITRIFAEFGMGRSPRNIARRLNEDRVPGPGGRPWADTTIRGQPERATGILNNALYRGILE